LIAVGRDLLPTARWRWFRSSGTIPLAWN